MPSVLEILSISNNYICSLTSTASNTRTSQQMEMQNTKQMSLIETV